MLIRVVQRTFNRTSVELKLDKMRLLREQPTLLIEPVWN